MKQREKRIAEERGFRDALAVGHPNPIEMEDHVQVAYDKGFSYGMRAVKRIAAMHNGDGKVGPQPEGGDPGIKSE